MTRASTRGAAFEHGDGEPALDRDGRDFEPHIAAADDHQTPAGLHVRLQQFDIGDRAQVKNIARSRRPAPAMGGHGRPSR